MEEIEIIKKTIGEMLVKMRFEGDVMISNTDSNEDGILVNIKTSQAAFLIGQAGATLDALQYLARVMVNKKTEKPVRFLLDVNNYRKNRINLLKETAKSIAKQALTERVAVTLQPMAAYERRVIHLALVDHPQVSTQSIGFGSDRRIVVRPIE